MGRSNRGRRKQSGKKWVLVDKFVWDGERYHHHLEWELKRPVRIREFLCRPGLIGRNARRIESKRRRVLDKRLITEIVDEIFELDRFVKRSLSGRPPVKEARYDDWFWHHLSSNDRYDIEMMAKDLNEPEDLSWIYRILDEEEEEDDFDDMRWAESLHDRHLYDEPIDMRVNPEDPEWIDLWLMGWEDPPETDQEWRNRWDDYYSELDEEEAEADPINADHDRVLEKKRAGERFYRTHRRTSDGSQPRT